jgi:hypothetical protein
MITIFMTAPNNNLNIKCIITMLLIIFSTKSFCADSTKVNVAVKAFSKMLPASFKIDSIYEVKSIQQIDLNGDSALDKVITWKRKKFTEGDTIKTSIYFNKDSTDVFINTYKNLYTLEFSYWNSQSKGSKKLDSLKNLYVDSNYGMIEFSTNKIIIGVCTSSWDGCDYHFIYNHKKRNWYLKYMQWWEGWNYLARKKGDLQKVTETFPIEEFNILKILGY